jgi:hypothetical protein
MPTLPDHGSAHHDGARRPVPVPTQAAAGLALVKRFSPAGWQIENPHGEFWLATRKRGSEQRIIAAQTVITLYGKLQRIETDEPAHAGPRGTYPDSVAAYLAYLDDLGRVGTGQ